MTLGNAKANAVLAVFFDMFREKAYKLHVEAYVNGREQGFCLNNYTSNRKVSFSENRNSDSIVVYHGFSSDFLMQGNTPSEAVYRGASRYFAYNEYELAAQFIHDMLIM